MAQRTEQRTGAVNALRAALSKDTKEVWVESVSTARSSQKTVDIEVNVTLRGIPLATAERLARLARR